MKIKKTKKTRKHIGRLVIWRRDYNHYNDVAILLKSKIPGHLSVYWIKRKLCGTIPDDHNSLTDVFKFID